MSASLIGTTANKSREGACQITSIVLSAAAGADAVLTIRDTLETGSTILAVLNAPQKTTMQIWLKDGFAPNGFTVVPSGDPAWWAVEYETV